MTDTLAETHIFGQIPDSSDNLYRLKNIGKTRQCLLFDFYIYQDFVFGLFIADKIKDDVTNGSLVQNESISVKNGSVNGKPIGHSNGTTNGQIIYRNGNTKSDVAVIDIIEDGKS